MSTITSGRENLDIKIVVPGLPGLFAPIAWRATAGRSDNDLATTKFLTRFEIAREGKAHFAAADLCRHGSGSAVLIGFDDDK